MNADLGTARAAEIFFCLFGAGAVEAVRLRMVALELEGVALEES
jgi:hypothetical protein